MKFENFLSQTSFQFSLKMKQKT